MATPVPTLVGSIVETSSDGSIAIPNTTAPTEGDMLVAFISGFVSGGSESVNTPTGWTIRANQTADTHPCTVYTKVATSGDVSATDFTFTLTGGVDVMTGVIISSTNIASFEASELDTGTTSYSATTNLTATTDDSLILTMFTSSNTTGGGGTTSTYTSTPTLTWTEQFDTPGNNGSAAMSCAVVTATNTGTGTITARSATASVTPARTRSIMVMLNGVINATGTNALLSVSPTHLTQNGVAGATGTNNLLSVSPTIQTQNGSGGTSTVWTNETKT